jgi:hypothetical protein
MTRLLLCLLAALVVGGVCWADTTTLPADAQKTLRDASRFHEVHAATNLPPEVFALCADGSGRLAEPGQKWEATDAITDPKLPTKRLIWAFTDGDFYVVHYERGGRGHSFHILVARIKEPKLAWYGAGIVSQFKDYSAFLEAWQAGKLKDGSDYAH